MRAKNMKKKILRDNELKPSIFYLPTHTSSSTGAGGGGKVDLSTLRLFAFSLPLFVFAFFPITTTSINNKRDQMLGIFLRTIDNMLT